MLATLVVLVLLGLSSACINLGSEKFCYADVSGQAHRFYGTKTTYTNAYELLKAQNRVVKSVPDGCQPVMFYLFSRHAIRYPEAEEIEDMAKELVEIRNEAVHSYDAGQSELCEKDIEALRAWQLNMVPTNDNHVTDSGYKETVEIAKRYRQLYPDLLDASKSNIKVIVSRRERTNETALAFLEGTIDNEDKSAFEFAPETSEITEFHTYCEENLAKQGLKLGKPEVVKKFHNSDLMKSIIERVSKRLGLSKTLNAKQFKLISRACSYGISIFKDGTWCSAFTNEELEVLEYMEDLDDFHKDGYGRDINAKMPCLMVSHLLKSIDKAMKLRPLSSEKPDTYLVFSHAGAIKRLAPYFGLFNSFGSNNSKHHENFCANDKGSDRTWRSGLISPFGANYAFVLHNCPKKDGTSQFKIQTLVQESPVVVSGCDSEMCSAQQFVSRYQSALSCDLDRICRI